MSHIAQDLRYAWRQFRVHPGYALVAVFVFALGIGINTAVFSVVNAFLFRPLPVSAPGELVSIYEGSTKSPRTSRVSYNDYLNLKERNQAFTGVACWFETRVPLSATEQTEVALAEVVSTNYFDVLGVRPALGRAFQSDGESITQTVISDSLWKREFHADPDIVGKSIKLNGSSFTIIGVAPSQFKGLWFPGVSAQVWVSLDALKLISGRSGDVGSALMIGRLKPSVTLKQAQAIIETQARQLPPADQETDGERVFRLFAANDIRIFPDPSSDIYPRLISLALMAVVASVLMIAGANISGILLARGISRTKEIAVRIAIGAGRWQLMRQLVTENLILSMAGSILGLLVARLLIFLAVFYAPVHMLFAELALDIPIDVRVLLFTLLVGAGIGLLVSLGPAWRASKTDVLSSLSAETFSAPRKIRSRLRYWIVIPQVCLSLSLLIVAGSIVRAVLKTELLNPGFDTEHTAMAGIDLTWNKFPEEKQKAFYHRLLEQAQSSPDITAAALTDFVPLSLASPSNTEFVFTDRDLAENRRYRLAQSGHVSPGYFRTMAIPILRGRDLDPRDGPEKIVVAEATARLFWPGEDPIGKRLSFAEERQHGDLRGLEVVGVAANVRKDMSDRAPLPFFYSSFAARPTAYLVARSSQAPSLVVDRLRKLIRSADENVAIEEAKTMEESISLMFFPLRMAATLFCLCGLFGVLLAATGLYGVVSYSIAQRTREIGIRAALGAQQKDIVGMVLRDGIKVVTIGSVIGFLLALAIRRILWSFSLGIVSLDLITCLGAPLLLGAVILAAGYIPARRAARVDPMTALRDTPK